MGYHWATNNEADHPDMESLVKICGFADADEATDDSLDRELDLEGVRKIRRSSSDPQAPSKFKAGDKVTFVKRVTLLLPIVGISTSGRTSMLELKGSPRDLWTRTRAVCS